MQGKLIAFMVTFLVAEICRLAQTVKENAEFVSGFLIKNTNNVEANEFETEKKNGEINMELSELGRAALHYASLGYRVFPCSPNTKIPPADSHGCKDAASDPSIIEKIWTDSPNSNIGISTDAMLVLDVDIEEGDPPNPWLTADRADEFSGVPCSKTPRGGQHFLFKGPGKNTASHIADHIDTRGKGGYFVAAPSVVNGKMYTWLRQPCPMEELEPAPKWLVEAMLGKNGHAKAPGSPQEATNGAILQKSRNVTLTSLAGKLRRSGLSAKEILAALFQMNADRCKPPLSKEEVEAIANSVARYEPAQEIGPKKAIPSRAYTLDEIEAEMATFADAIRVPSSIVGVDQLLGEDGFSAPRLVLYAGYTGSGKTSVLLTEGLGAALRGHPVLLVTLELSRFEIYRKKIAKIFEVEPRPHTLPFQILDGTYDLNQIIASIDAWLDGISNPLTPIVVVDYAQKVSLTTRENRERQVALVAEEFQRLGRRRNILIFLGAQLNRDSAKSDKPEIYHLRESGLLEQVADFVFLLQKLSYDRLKIYIAKNRWGTGDREIGVSVDFERCAFGELTPQQQYKELNEIVVEALQSQRSKKMSGRDASMTLKWNGKHPSKSDILAASLAFRHFMVEEGMLILDVAQRKGNSGQQGQQMKAPF